MKQRLLTIACCVLLTACTSQWVKTHSNTDEYITARISCETQAEQTFPIKNEAAYRTKFTTTYEPCMKIEDCKGHETRPVRKAERENYVIEVNKKNREQVFNQCMAKKGWENKKRWMLYPN